MKTGRKYNDIMTASQIGVRTRIKNNSRWILPYKKKGLSENFQTMSVEERDWRLPGKGIERTLKILDTVLNMNSKHH